jgi:hypothetical protein
MVEPRECLRVGHRAGSLVPDILMRPADSQRHVADEVTPLLIDDMEHLSLCITR